MSMLLLACQRHDLSTAELLLQHGACDADLSIMTSAVSNDDTEVIGVLLSHQHAYADTKFAINRAAMLSVLGQAGSDAADGSVGTRSTISSLSSLLAIMIDWRALKLRRLAMPWLSQACLSYMRMSSAGSPPPRLLQTSDHYAAYLVTRIDVSENQLTSLPSMLFSLPSLRILIAAGNQVSLRVTFSVRVQLCHSFHVLFLLCICVVYFLVVFDLSSVLYFPV